MRNPYEVLGVSRTASDAEIKKAFRRLAKQHHPDRNADDPQAKERFAEVNTAYEILSDKEKRGQFDRGEIDAEGKPRAAGFEGFGFRPGAGTGQGRTWRYTSGGAEETFGAEDILKEFFGGTFTRRTASGPGMGAEARGPRQTVGEPPRRGEDVTATARIPLADLVAGAKARVSLPTGRTLDVSIPTGVEPGQQIRLKGQGMPGAGGGTPGDALVTIQFEPHPLFRVDDTNLRLDLPVSLDEAVLGAKVRVPTLDGAVELSIPAGTSGARALRVRGKGLPTKLGGRGDLFVTPRIVLPEEADAGLTQLMQRWREMKPYSPRGPEFGA